MRIGGIWQYHARTSWRALALMSAIVLVLFVGILVVMMPYMAGTVSSEINIGTNNVTLSTTEFNKPSLGAPFGTSGSIYIAFMWVFTLTAMTTDRKYLLSNNVSRHEFIIGTFLSIVTMAAVLTATQYVLDLLCRIATYAMGFQIRGMAWSPKLILLSTKDYLPSLMSQMGNMIAMSGTWGLIVLLFTRWKKSCIAVLVLMLLLPTMMVSFLPANWLEWVIENAAYVLESMLEFFREHKWLFLIDVPAWQVLVQQTTVGAIMYALSYLVIRKLPVRSK